VRFGLPPTPRLVCTLLARGVIPVVPHALMDHRPCERAQGVLNDLVRAGHRTPFVVADDWTRIDAAAVSASLMRSAATIAGRGSVTRVEIVSQAPRRRTGIQTG
jgi:hypothetical protein